GLFITLTRRVLTPSLWVSIPALKSRILADPGLSPDWDAGAYGGGGLKTKA
ncbi:MAG: hypothetical protein RJB54_289, partial [Actinomycetota bacterium]